MKKILLIIILAISLNFTWARNKQESKIDCFRAKDLLDRIMPDSICHKLKNNQIIFYSRGHYGYSWALIAKSDNRLRGFIGKVRYSGEATMEEIAESNQLNLDTLFEANRDILDWGFDTISSESANLTANKSSIYCSVTDDILVFNTDGECIFKSNGAASFSGPDSLEFNKKYHNLGLIMMWLSQPEIKQYIPNHAIFSRP